MEMISTKEDGTIPAPVLTVMVEANIAAGNR
jgi:hypothetical protein